MLGFLMYFPHNAQITRNALETLSPAIGRVFFSSQKEFE